MRKRYKCKLVDYSDTLLVVDYPVKITSLKTAFFLEGAKFQASFSSGDDAVYSFAAEVRAQES
ncbi:flagellar brake protein [Halobacillus sp. Marseille-Q1614]|uniref:flagellar brake protein n=1 Tax=Halobacillus sp. Marseille-Q1614 TaxID=2709134 RepID=UPI00210FC3E5|nr:flagellar brake protein [Halobacillus sp. Marseille-Q1614]